MPSLRGTREQSTVQRRVSVSTRGCGLCEASCQGDSPLKEVAVELVVHLAPVEREARRVEDPHHVRRIRIAAFPWLELHAPLILSRQHGVQ